MVALSPGGIGTSLLEGGVRDSAGTLIVIDCESVGALITYRVGYDRRVGYAELATRRIDSIFATSSTRSKGRV